MTQASSPSSPLRRLTLLAALALLGVAASAYQSYHFYEVRGGKSSFNSFCNLSSTVNCDVVSASRYAELFFGIPLSSAAAGWFLALFFVSWLARNPFWFREALRAAFLLTASGALFSLAYFLIMAVVLKTYCLVCLLIDTLILASLATVISLKPEGLKSHKPDPEKWKLLAGTLATSLILTMLGFSFLNSASTAIDPHLKEAFKEAPISILNTPPVSINTNEKLPFFGAKDTLITIVEFSDFQCPHCKKGAFLMHALLNRFPGKLKIIPRHFPLDASCNRSIQHRGHPFACEAARAVLCAQSEGKFEPMYEALFENQSALSSSTIVELAKKAGLNEQNFAACMASAATAARLSEDIEEALRLNLQSTPTFFINGRKVEGTYTLEVWTEVIKKLLQPS